MKVEKSPFRGITLGPLGSRSLLRTQVYFEEVHQRRGEFLTHSTSVIDCCEGPVNDLQSVVPNGSNRVIKRETHFLLVIEVKSLSLNPNHSNSLNKFRCNDYSSPQS